MSEGERYEISVRATRAYVAGFGSSGSLLAGAAVLFLVASAIVALEGWPQIATGAANSNLTAAPLAATSHAAGRLATALRATRPTPLTRPHAAARAGAAHSSTARSGVLAAGPVAAGTPRRSSPVAVGVSAAGGTVAAACSGCGSGHARSPLSVLTKSLARTVSNVGNDVGQQIGVFSAIGAQQVSVADPQAGSVVASAGSSAESALKGTSKSAAGVVSGLASGR